MKAEANTDHAEADACLAWYFYLSQRACQLSGSGTWRFELCRIHAEALSGRMGMFGLDGIEREGEGSETGYVVRMLLRDTI